MWRRVHLYLLKQLYRRLIVKISMVEKKNLARYNSFRVFHELKLQTNRGVFTFIFKEDRRHQVRGGYGSRFILASYFVELLCPEPYHKTDNVFNDKIAVVVKVKLRGVNYEAIASLLFDLYVDHFSQRHPGV